MPTEKQIEAASLAIIDYLDEFHPAPEGFLYTAMARDALTAAEAVEVWDEADAELISAAMEYFDDDGDLSRLDPAETDHLLHLARVGAGRKSR